MSALDEVTKIIAEKPRSFFGDFLELPTLGVPVKLYAALEAEMLDAGLSLLTNSEHPMPNVLFRGVWVHPE